MKDYMVRAISRNGNIRGLACVTTRLVNESCRIHDTWPTASIALGRALTGAALMGGLLKDGQRVALKFEGNGPLKKIIAEADHKGAVRGYVGAPQVEVPLKNGNFDVAGALGRAGFLTVSKDLGLKEPYRGIVQLYTSEIAEDIAFYLMESEQIPSAVGIGIFAEPDTGISVSGGFLLQSLPPSDEALIRQLVKQMENMPPITEMLQSGKSPEDMLSLIFRDIPIDILGKQELVFKCSCSRMRMEQAVIALGSDEIRSIAEELGQADISCEFCRSHYIFSREELEKLIQEST